MTLPEIQEIVEGLEKESKAIKAEIFKLAWYMRGGLSFSEAYQLDPTDREIIGNIVKDNLEMTKETKLPFF